jgi:tyrosinase
MKITTYLSVALVGSTNAKFMENDLLAAEGMARLGIHLAKNGLPSPGTCTLDKVSVRREW